MHSTQSTVEVALYCPGVQAVHVVPVSAARVSVIEPAPHAMQLAKPAVLYSPMVQAAQSTVEAALYCPGVQAVHVVAASAAKVSVIEPAAHAMQLSSPST